MKIHLFTALCAISAMSACGAGPLQTQARAATIASLMVRESGNEIVRARREALARVEASTVGQEPAARLAADTAEMERWAPALLGYEALRGALTMWVESIALAASTGDDGQMADHVLPFVVDVIEQWHTLAQLGVHLGVPLPDVPDVILKLVLTTRSDQIPTMPVGE